MLRFNIIKLERGTKDVNEFMQELISWHKIRSGPKSKLLTYQGLNLAGRSFLISPDPLLYNKKIDIIHKVQYVKLAGRRDYSLYKLYEIRYLDLTFFPDINLPALKTNPLLSIETNKIHFKFEE
jgi:hypothetical protein